MKRILWVLTSLLLAHTINTHAGEADNRVFLLSKGYVQAIEGKNFLPGSKPSGARKVASTVSLVQGKGINLIVDPGMAAEG